MTIAYYRKADGKIRHSHIIPKENLQDIEKNVAAYNEAMKGKESCHIVEYEDDSFEAFLYKRAADLSASIDAMKDAETAMSDALNMISDVLDSLD